MIFQAAEAFLALCATAQKTVNMGNASILTLVMGTNGAFALESYLKCLRMLECGEYLEGHDLQLLFTDLPDALRKEIEERHLKYELKHPVFKKMQAAGIATDLHSLLKVGKDSFQEFRYAYEELPKDTVWGLDVMMFIVKALILERKPEWDFLQLNRSKLPVV